MAEPPNPDPGSRVPIRSASGMLTPCYLVIQPTSWCSEYKHVIDYSIAWRQCELHWPGWHGWLHDRKFELCRPEKREERVIVLPHAHINDPSRVKPQSACATCTAIRNDPVVKDLKEQRNGRTGTSDSPIHVETDAQRLQQQTQIDARIKDRVFSLAKEYELRMMQVCRAYYMRNPPLKIYMGPVHSAEKTLRQQCPFMDESDPITVLQHPTKKMRDP